MGELNFGRVKPTFMIIGAQKCGTTSLHKYLLQHPRLISPEKKELHFFDKMGKEAISNYNRQFPVRFFSNQLSFESTPSYLYYPLAAKRIFEYNPKLKFIVLLRNPVERAYSAWNMFRKHAGLPEKIKVYKKNSEKESSNRLYDFFYKNDFPSFETWMEMELSETFIAKLLEPSIIKRGYYKKQIENWFSYFSKEQFLFIDSSELKKEPLKILNNISDFLGIDDFEGSKLNLEIKHKSEYEAPINDETYRYLLAHYQNKNEGLEKLIDLKLDWLEN
jgi:hypothetical protein